MGNNASKTPAPLVDRVKGSRTNKSGSAASKKSAQGIKLNASIIAGLTKKAKEYNEKNPKGKVSVTTLKAVMRRGMGAYSSSHRPTITGGAPNTRQAWAYARVNAFLRKKGGQGAKPTYVQDNDLLEDGGLTKHGLHLIIKNINKENMYGGTYKKIFDVIDDDVEFYNPFGTEYEELKGNDLHIFVTPRPDSHVIEKISKIKNVEVTDVEYTDVKNTDGYYADGGQLGKEITCVNCGWHWNTNDSDPSDKYVCHKCGYDNRTYYDKDPIGEFNKYEIYKSIGPLRQANETIEKIEYMERQNKMEGGGEIYNPKNIQVGDYVEYQKWYFNWVYTIKGKVIEIVESEFLFPNTNYKKAKAKILIETKFGQRGALPHQKTTTIDISKLQKITKDGKYITPTLTQMADGGAVGVPTTEKLIDLVRKDRENIIKESLL
jgi:hypothetical protein